MQSAARIIIGLVVLGVVICTGCARGPRALTGREVAASPTPVVPPIGTAIASDSPGAAATDQAESSLSATSRAQIEESVVPLPSPPPESDGLAGPASALMASGSGAGVLGETRGQPLQAGLVVQDVFFDFDEATLREEQRAALREVAGWLRTNPDVVVTLEGYCDERGSVEYNIGLGERRAGMVRDELVARGVEPRRLTTISYGSERPFVLGHDESAWRWNRRVHLTLERR